MHRWPPLSYVPWSSTLHSATAIRLACPASLLLGGRPPPLSLLRFPRSLFTIEAAVHHEETIRKSRFVALAAPVRNARECAQLLSSASHPHATHHCYAYRLADGSSRSRGDGEPAGVAGPPLLTALERASLHGVLLLVARFYGGVKLGAPALLRAYGGVGSRCLRAAARRPLRRTAAARVRFAPADTGAVYAVLREQRAEAVACGEGLLAVEFEAPAEEMQRLCARLVDATHGRASCRLCADDGEASAL
ncbi:hypothetical protein AB1Y20_006401 [Prymnesium parvum]|uniref:Impact N-terminal domain-containing protein n=1 Tax=Prymnesium parvum TaxID=97485 RepID=A0AB34J2L8_PRYPA